MSNKEILTKAILKAIDSGWRPGWVDRRPVVSWDASYSTDFNEGEGVQVIGYHAKSNPSIWFFPIRELIFNHDFANALWGEELHHHVFIVPEDLNKRFAGTQELDVKPTWQYHLQQLVIAPDPIKYLGEKI